MAQRSDVVERTSEGGLTIIRLSRPAAMNTLTLELKLELEAVTADFFSDPGQRCLLITGSGDAFCAGGDLQTLKDGQTPAETRDRLALSHGWTRRLLRARG
jgi:2-(1,2-epoxy-1,2-dihydrophenyl)acetyl-CoA isomerase